MKNKLTEDKLFTKEFEPIKNQTNDIFKENQQIFEGFYGENQQPKIENKVPKVIENVKDKFTTAIQIAGKTIIVPNLEFIEECKKSIKTLKNQAKQQERLIEKQTNELTKLRIEHQHVLKEHNNLINNLNERIDSSIRLTEQLQIDIDNVDRKY